jgi:hypothetical protein
MDKETKKELLESLLYFMGILGVLKRESKKSKLDSYKEYKNEHERVSKLIDKIKQLN